MRPGRELLTVTLVALAVRVALAAATGLDGPPVEDERGYVLLAGSLAHDGTLALPLPDDLVAATGTARGALRAFRGPLLPLLGAPLAALGVGAVGLRLLSLVAGTLCAPVLLLGLRRRIAPRAAFGTALAYAAWPPLAYTSVRALTEPLGLLLLLLAATSLVRGDRLRDAAAAGAWGGLAVLARPALLLPAVALAPVAGRRLRAVLFVAGLVACVAPWVQRNHRLFGRPLLSTNSGVTLVGGNSAAAARAEPPGKWLPPGVVYADADDPPDLGMYGWSALGEGESDRRFASDALRWVRDEPAAAARLAFWKVVRLLDPDPRSRKPDAGRKALVGWLTLGPVLLLAAVGARAAWRERAAVAVWAAPAAATVVTVVVFYGDTRMRAAADPCLLVVAALGVRSLLLRGRRERGARVLVE